MPLSWIILSKDEKKITHSTSIGFDLSCSFCGFVAASGGSITTDRHSFSVSEEAGLPRYYFMTPGVLLSQAIKNAKRNYKRNSNSPCDIESNDSLNWPDQCVCVLLSGLRNTPQTPMNDWAQLHRHRGPRTHAHTLEEASPDSHVHPRCRRRPPAGGLADEKDHENGSLMPT